MVGFLQVRDAGQRTVVAAGPAVVGAGEAGGVTAVRAAQAVAAMAADVQEGAHLAAVVAYDQNRVFTHIGGEKVPRLRDLAFVAQEQPAAGENLLLLLFVDIGLDKDAAADEAVVAVHQLADIVCHGLSWLTALSFAAACARSIRRRP